MIISFVALSGSCDHWKKRQPQQTLLLIPLPHVGHQKCSSPVQFAEEDSSLSGTHSSSARSDSGDLGDLPGNETSWIQQLAKKGKIIEVVENEI